MPPATARFGTTPSFLPPRSVILVVDADSATRGRYREALALDGHVVVEASDGRDALVRAFQIPRLALVITARDLPLLDGHRLCAILQADAATSAVPILIVGGDPLAGDPGVLVHATTPESVVADAKHLLSGACDKARAAPAARKAYSVQLPRLQRPGRRTQSKLMRRFSSTTPPLVPGPLVCPTCDAALSYRHSYMGGVSDRHPEQWDYYVCPSSCGAFQYRQRTRKLRGVATVPAA